MGTLNLAPAIALGGRMAPHLERFHLGNGVYHDTNGRILKYDPKTERISIFLEGGPAKDDGSIHLSNPDNMALDSKRNMLVIHEDINAMSEGRVPVHAARQNRLINEIYFLDLSIEKPTLDDLKRFAVAPAGAETTGGIWSPDFSTLFFNIQHPSPLNPPPFDLAGTVVVTGFK
ncbi:MAG: alkaline phosphatase PhoX [Bacteroidota bacterium]